MKNSTVASRYAKSLLDLAIERNQMDVVFEDMQLVSQTISTSHELRVLLGSPVVHPDKKIHILKAIFAGKIGELSQLFADLIIQKKRADLLGQIAEEAVIQVKHMKGIVIVEVTTAIPLNDEMREKIKTLASGIVPGTIELHEKVDPEIIGGFIVKANDSRLDSSISTRFRKLKQEFLQNPFIPVLQ